MRAPAAGVVSFVGVVPSSGRTVTIQTDGYAVSLTHLGEATVAKGATVAEGDAVGVAGQSGEVEWPTPYVHLGIRVSSAADGYVDPATLLPPRAVAPPPPPAGEAPAPAPSPAPAVPPVTSPVPAPVTPPSVGSAPSPPVGEGAAAAAASAPVAPREPAATASTTATSTAAPTGATRAGGAEARAGRPGATQPAGSNPAEPAGHRSARLARCPRREPSDRTPERVLALPTPCVRASPRAPGVNGAASTSASAAAVDAPGSTAAGGPQARTSSALSGGARRGLGHGSRSSRRCGRERASPPARS